MLILQSMLFHHYHASTVNWKLFVYAKLLISKLFKLHIVVISQFPYFQKYKPHEHYQIYSTLNLYIMLIATRSLLWSLSYELSTATNMFLNHITSDGYLSKTCFKPPQKNTVKQNTYLQYTHRLSVYKLYC